MNIISTIKFIQKNPYVVTFFVFVFVAAWRAGIFYENKIPLVNKIPEIENDVSTLKQDVALLKLEMKNITKTVDREIGYKLNSNAKSKKVSACFYDDGQDFKGSVFF